MQPGNARYLSREGNMFEVVAGSLVDGTAGETVKMANSWPVAAFGLIIWLIMACMNVANLVLLGIGA